MDDKKKGKSNQKKRSSVRGQAGASNDSKQFHDNSPAAQQARILEWFFKRSSRLSTLQARELLGIMSPACRIMELREMGHRIVLEWEYQVDVAGSRHRTGVYVYMGLPKPNLVREGKLCHA